MRYQLTGLLGFFLVFCTSVVGQQTTLVVQDDRHDPCRRFKMRVLVPEDTAKQIAERTPQNTLDPGIVWNPCVTNSVEFASTFPSIPLKNNSLVINLNDSEPKLETRQIQPAATPTTAPQKPRFKRRHD